MQRLPEKIAFLTTQLQILKALPQVLEVRQCGFIAGIEIGPYPQENLTGVKVCLAARKHGLLTRPVLDTLVLMPPLSATLTEIETMVEALRLSIHEVCD